MLKSELRAKSITHGPHKVFLAWAKLTLAAVERGNNGLF
jgi:hypothetical protein